MKSLITTDNKGDLTGRGIADESGVLGIGLAFFVYLNLSLSLCLCVVFSSIAIWTFILLIFRCFAVTLDQLCTFVVRPRPYTTVQLPSGIIL